MIFLQNFFATILGVLVAVVFLFLVLLGVASLIAEEDQIAVAPNSVLVLQLNASIKDYAPRDGNPFRKVFDAVEDKLGLDAILHAIENAKDDDHIRGISIETKGINAGIPQLYEVRNALESFKKSGKFVYAYADFYRQKDYYLSSVADSLFLNPMGAVDFRGLRAEVLYYKEFEDNFGVHMEVVRHGKYKSAVEPFLRSTMSEKNREQITSFLQSIWAEMVENIGTSRSLSAERLRFIADHVQGRDATHAKESTLIDAAIYEDTYRAKIESATDEEVKTISLANYIRAGNGKRKSEAEDKIAILYAQGQIVYGEGNEDFIGQEILKKALKKIREDDDIKAVVLRINSPGGSALASELIWREIEITKKEKPVVVSMGNLAASGGYYIACNADKIIADPTTITGSIGVFGMFPNVHTFTRNIGINAEQVATNKSPSYSLFEPITKPFYTLAKEQIERIYKKFVHRVSAGRNMTFEQVDSIAQGRVWSGKEALGLGLVDELGGLEKAVETAAQLADIDAYKIRSYPRYKKNIKDMFPFPFAKLEKEALLKEALGKENYKWYHRLEQLARLKGTQAVMPFVLEIN